MATSTCPSCGAPDDGANVCATCLQPFDRSVRPDSPQAASPRQEGAGQSETGDAPVQTPDPPVLQPAGFFRRFFAFALDWIVLSILADIVRFAYRFGGDSRSDMVSMDAAMGLSAILFFLYFTLFTAGGGQTLGKMVMGVRVVRMDGKDLSYGMAFLRAFGYIISSFFFCLGFLWAIWDRRKQAWHDKIAGTIVIKT
ncbi:MAG: RDD family protein [bacterium]|nr:RDD family protein [bacterium]MDT8396091.1 RDD family protein [bacterium]